MAVNDAALDLITSSEGWVNKWYKDPVGIWTCCYGHTDAAGDPLYDETKGKIFTKDDGRAILAADLRSVEASVRRYVKVPLDENQFGALVSFAYNVGIGNFQDSTLLKLLNAGDYHGAAGQFGKWVKGGRPKKTLPGLVTRRKAEAALFTTPVTGTPVQPVPVPPATSAPTTPLPPAPVPSAQAGSGLNWGKVALVVVVVGLLIVGAIAILK